MFIKTTLQLLLAISLMFNDISITAPCNIASPDSTELYTISESHKSTSFTPTLRIGNCYYYNQLSNEEKRVYDALIGATNKFIDGEDVTLIISPYDENNKKGYLYYYYFVKRIIKAYTFDNPEAVVWFENYNRTYYIADNKDYVYMNLTPKSPDEATSSLNASNLKEELTQLQNKAHKFVKTLKGTDAEKLAQIYNWIINNVSYDKSISFPDRDNIYGPLMKGKAICSGYSYAFKYIADLAGLDVIYVTGKVYDDVENQFSPHAWNLAYVDGKLLMVDVTFGCTDRAKYLLVNPNDNIHFIENGFNFTYPL